MRVGLSFSRCVRDIVEGRVDIDDVLVIISSTNFDPHNNEQWTDIWQGYGGGGTFGNPFSNPEWINYSDEDEDRFRSVAIELWETGRLHQPRQFGGRPQRQSYYWLETVLPNSELSRNSAAMLAWQQFQIVAGLTNIKLEPK
jgi:hypothetical protein